MGCLIGPAMVTRFSQPPSRGEQQAIGSLHAGDMAVDGGGEGQTA